MEHPIILAIESSCDETSAAIIANGKVLNNIIASQEVHAKYGGVVPELASRAHQKNIVSTVHQALEAAHIKSESLDAIAFTAGPGLMGALLVGASFAKGMALALKKPLIEVNHMQAHILAHFIQTPGESKPEPSFPFLCLTISGGHTQLTLVKDFQTFEILGQTLDDAVGEAFDKAAKMLGLPYPGGPHIDKLAKTGNPKRFPFSKSDIPGLNFSFSGIKTSLLYFLRNHATDKNFVEQHLADICASYQDKLIAMLMEKTLQAAKQFKIAHIALAGGVAANAALRQRFTEEGKKHNWQTYIPAFEYCTDNAAMIAMAAHIKYQQGLFADLTTTPKANFQEF